MRDNLTKHQANEIKCHVGIFVANEEGVIDWDALDRDPPVALRQLVARLRKTYDCYPTNAGDLKLIREALADVGLRRAIHDAKQYLADNGAWWKAFCQLKFTYLVACRQEKNQKPDLAGWTSFAEGGAFAFFFAPKVHAEEAEQVETEAVEDANTGEPWMKVGNSVVEDGNMPSLPAHARCNNCSPDCNIFAIHRQLLAGKFAYFRRLTLHTWCCPIAYGMFQKMETCFKYITRDFEGMRADMFLAFKTEVHDDLWGNVNRSSEWLNQWSVITCPLRMLVCTICDTAVLEQSYPNLQENEFRDVLEPQKQKHLPTRACTKCNKKTKHCRRLQITPEGLVVRLAGNRKRNSKLTEVFKNYRESYQVGDETMKLDMATAKEFYKEVPYNHCISIRRDGDSYYKWCDEEPTILETQYDTTVEQEDEVGLDCLFLVTV